MDSAYVKNLIMTVINHSESSCWEDAVTEWEIYDCEEDDSCSSEKSACPRQKSINFIKVL